MADRAQYLARTLIARLANLQSILAEEGRGEPDRRQRIEIIEKVLVVELGITDATTLGMIEAALPDVNGRHPVGDREVAALAEFLRLRLGSVLSAP